MSVSCRTVLYCSTAVFLLLGALFCLKPGAVWITDNGNKYIMMRHFAQGGGKIIPHAVPELFPTGGFHFIKVPDGDAAAFSEKAKKYELLLVPSDSFGVPGFVRASYCVSRKTILDSLPAFEKLMKEYK